MRDDDFASLVKRVREGDRPAANELARRYWDYSRRLVGKKLPQALRSRIDSADLAQEIWGDLLNRDNSTCGKFEDSTHLRRYVAGAVKNQVSSAIRRSRSLKLDLEREVPIEVRKGSKVVTRDFAATEATPSEQVQAEDCRRQIYRGRNDEERRMIDLRMEGLTFEEIGRMLGRDEKTVRGIFQKIAKRLEARS